jgi:hypothetical protein
MGDSVWEELWSRLCHQGTVYSASFAALPSLEAAARRWPAEHRLPALALGASIVVATDVEGRREEFLRGFEETVARLGQLALETIARPLWSRGEYVYLLQAALAFQGDPLWGRQLEGLASGEFHGMCPSCGADLYVVVGEKGFFVSADDWVSQPARRVAIEPQLDNVPPVGRWLRDQALAAQQPEIANWIRYVFGTSSCPRCGQPFAVPDAIKSAA